MTDATAKQFIALYGEVDGWKNYDKTTKAFDESIREELKVELDAEKVSSRESITGVNGLSESVRDDYEGKADELNTQKLGATEKLGDIVRQIVAEIKTHNDDARSFQRLLQENKEIAQQFKLLESEVDGRITYVDRKSKLCHIDLGSENHIHAGQRFEVHEIKGKGEQHFKGAIEVVRTISRYYSLCVILDVVDADDGADIIREGDAVINQIWHKGKYLKVALHGQNWTPPQTKYDKFRLEKMLENIGVNVQEKLKPNTDIVILGGRAAFDRHFLDTFKKLRVKLLTEERIRLYVDPR